VGLPYLYSAAPMLAIRLPQSIEKRRHTCLWLGCGCEKFFSRLIFHHFSIETLPQNAKCRRSSALDLIYSNLALPYGSIVSMVPLGPNPVALLFQLRTTSVCFPQWGDKVSLCIRLPRNLTFSFAPCFLRRGVVSRLKLSSPESSGNEIRFAPSPR
jgi:hypothetical protein